MGFKMVAGGLLTGLGTGMVAQAQARREAAMARAKALREERHRQEDFAFKREQTKGERAYEREQTQAEQKFKLRRDEAKAKRESGQYATTVTGEGGELYGISKGLGVKDLGVKVAQDGKGSKGGGAGGGGLTASDKSLLERVSDKVWGKKDEEGQFMIPDDAWENYTLTNARSEELALAGVPTLKAGYIAALSVKGPLSKEEARKLAEAEADDQISGWFKGSERQKYIEQRTPELMRESREAERTYQRLVGGSGGKAGLLGSSAATPRTGADQQGYGQRADGTPKGRGYFGEIQRPGGDFSTELSIGVEIDGKETEIPAIVPTLTRQEIDHLMNGGEPTKAIIRKAVDHAKARMRQGKSAFAGPGEQRALPGSAKGASAQSGQKASKAPPGQGTQADPYKATTQADIQWFIDNAPTGAVIKADGKLYTK